MLLAFCAEQAKKPAGGAAGVHRTHSVGKFGEGGGGGGRWPVLLPQGAGSNLWFVGYGRRQGHRGAIERAFLEERSSLRPVWQQNWLEEAAGKESWRGNCRTFMWLEWDER